VVDKARISQVYGYLVCLIAVVTFLVSLNSAVGAALDLSDPQYSGRYSADPRLASFEAYRLELQQRRGLAPVAGEAPAPEPGDTAALRAAFEEARQEHLRSVRFQARRELVTSGLLAVVAAGLFVVHWIWLRRLGAPA